MNCSFTFPDRSIVHKALAGTTKVLTMGTRGIRNSSVSHGRWTMEVRACRVSFRWVDGREVIQIAFDFRTGLQISQGS